MHTSDSLETILSFLSTRVMDVIANGKLLRHLYFLLEFLAAWEKRPQCLTGMAYQWCFAISEAVGRLGQEEIPIIKPRPPLSELELKLRGHSRPGPTLRFRLGHRDLSAHSEGFIACVLAGGFSLERFGDSFESLDPLEYAQLLTTTLEIGFRLVTPSSRNDLDRTSHHDWVFETAFSSHDDELIADAMCVWITNPHASPVSCMRYFSKRMEEDTPLSQRLRRVSIWTIGCIGHRGLVKSGLEIIPLLDRLETVVDDIVERGPWGKLLMYMVHSSAGPGSLSSHYWSLLGKLVMFEEFDPGFGGGIGVMTSLEEAEDWEKLEVWVAIAWRSGIRSVERQLTIKLLSQRPSALPRFENLCGVLRREKDSEDLRQICNQARTAQPPPESPPPSPYVSVRPTQLLSVLIPFFCSSQPTHAESVVE